MKTIFINSNETRSQCGWASTEITVKSGGRRKHKYFQTKAKMTNLNGNIIEKQKKTCYILIYIYIYN